MPPTGRRTRVRWLMVFLAFSGTAISYIDRANLGVAATFIDKEFQLGNATMGLILGAFFWSYAGGQMPAGWFVDKVGARVAYTIAVVWWSIFTAAGAAAQGFKSLFVFRFLLGAGEAPAYPCNAKVVSDWFPRSERAFATSIFDSGARVGSALSLPIVTAIVAGFGWRMSFVITGALGIVWAVFWVALYRLPQDHKMVSDEERAYIEKGQTPVQVETDSGPKVRWRDLFRYRTIWGMMLGFFCLNVVIYFFITWFPTYLLTERGVNLKQLGTLGTLPALFAIPAGYLGGLASDALVRRGVRLTVARKLPIVGGLAMSSSIALAAIMPGIYSCLALLALCYGSLSFAAASIWSLPADIAPSKKLVASIGGVQNFAANLGGVACASLIGLMRDVTGGFTVPLVIAGGFGLVGAASYLFIVGDIAPLTMPQARALRAP